MAPSLLTDQVVLNSLLVTHLLNKIGNLLHGLLDLSHDAFLSVQRLLFLTSLRVTDHLNLGFEPLPDIFLVLGAEGDLVFKLASQILIHLPEHVGSRVG